jgi:flagellar protein FlaG
MSSKVQPAASVADALLGPAQQRPANPAGPAAPPPEAAPTQADMRLIIEEAGAPGEYLYTVIDRRTGEIVSRLPRQAVLKLRETADYAAGRVFDGKA